MAIDLFDFYRSCLIPLTPSRPVTKLLEVLMAGGETTEDFASVLSMDAEIQHWSRLTVQRMGRQAKGLDQVVLVLGQNRVRNLVIGRALERAFLREEECLLAEALNSDAEEGEKKKSDHNNEDEATVQDSAEEEPEAETTDEEQPTETNDIIPEITEFERYVTYAIKAEKVAIYIRNSYPGQAFVCGAIFDYMRHYLKSKDLDSLRVKALKDSEQYVARMFLDGLRSAVAMDGIMKIIVMKHQKIAFSSAMLHNIGKGLLLGYSPQQFESAFKSSTGADIGQLSLESQDAETGQFEFDHAQAGALFFRRLSFLQDIEKSIDFHHHPFLLQSTDPALYALSCALKVSGTLVKLFEKIRQGDPNHRNIKDKDLKESSSYKYLQLKPAEWDKIKKDYVNVVMEMDI